MEEAGELQHLTTHAAGGMQFKKSRNIKRKVSKLAASVKLDDALL